MNSTGITPEQMHEAILDSPAMKPPPGVTPNFVDPPNLRNDALTISLLVISTIFVWLRLYTKARVVHKLHLDDYLLILAWATYAMGFHYYAFKIHMLPPGVNQWNLKVRDLILSLKLGYFAEIFYVISQLPIKAAIITQCLRVFAASGQRNATFWACHILLWTNIIFYVVIVFLVAFACRPIPSIWDITIDDSKCINHTGLNYSFPIMNTISDLCILIVPQREIWRLQGMTQRKKVQLSALFLLGAFACFSSIMRLYYTVHIFYGTHDITYGLGLMGLWMEPELTAGFVAASAPVLPRLIKHLFPNLASLLNKQDLQRPVEMEFEANEVFANKTELRVTTTNAVFHNTRIDTDRSKSDRKGSISTRAGQDIVHEDEVSKIA